MSYEVPHVKRVITIYEFDDGTWDVSDAGVGMSADRAPWRLTRGDRDAAYDFVNEALYPGRAQAREQASNERLGLTTDYYTTDSINYARDTRPREER
jgi:hypothetical protein